MATAVVAQLPQDITPGVQEGPIAGQQALEQASPGEDLYTRLKTLQRQLEFLEIQARVRSCRGAGGVLPTTR